MSYQQSQQNRQEILDHLHANPLKSAAAVADSIGLKRTQVESCVRFMTSVNEIEKVGNGKATGYRAIATTTITAAAVIAEMQRKRGRSGYVAQKVQMGDGIVTAPGYYCQRGGKWEPKNGQGGQGALRREFGICSGLA